MQASASSYDSTVIHPMPEPADFPTNTHWPFPLYYQTLIFFQTAVCPAKMKGDNSQPLSQFWPLKQNENAMLDF